MTVTSRRTSQESRIRTIYATSDPDYGNDEDAWGQPSISHYDLSLHGEPIKGVYVPSLPARRLRLDPELAAEFEAWDVASDEDFMNFIENLD